MATTAQYSVPPAAKASHLRAQRLESDDASGRAVQLAQARREPLAAGTTPGREASSTALRCAGTRVISSSSLPPTYPRPRSSTPMPAAGRSNLVRWPENARLQL